MRLRQVLLLLLVAVLSALSAVDSLPEQGKMKYTVKQESPPSLAYFIKAMYHETKISMKVQYPCTKPTNVTIKWVLRRSDCPGEYFQASSATSETSTSAFRNFFENPQSTGTDNDTVTFIQGEHSEQIYSCPEDEKYFLSIQEAVNNETSFTQNTMVPATTTIGSLHLNSSNLNHSAQSGYHLIAHTWSEGTYLLLVQVEPIYENSTVDVIVSMLSSYGYLSAMEWPLLMFYISMFAIYGIYASVWFTCAIVKRKSLHGLHFWIGAALLLGVFETATFYAEYQAVNSTGQSIRGAIIVAEVLSCLKRTLLRLIIIIISGGYGIVKAKLGNKIYIAVLVCVLYFILAAVRSGMRLLKDRIHQPNQPVLAGIPLAILDVAMAFLVFSSLTRTKKSLMTARKSTAKLSVFRYFTWVIIFAMLISVSFIIGVFFAHRMDACLYEWRALWISDGFWQILYSFLLLAFMILFRPVSSSSRPSFEALSESDDDNILMEIPTAAARKRPQATVPSNDAI